MIVAGTAVFNAESPRDVIHFLRQRCVDAQARIKSEREGIAAGRGSEAHDDDVAAVQGLKSGATTPLSQPRTYMSAAAGGATSPPPAAQRNGIGMSNMTTMAA